MNDYELEILMQEQVSNTLSDVDYLAIGLVYLTQTTAIDLIQQIFIEIKTKISKKIEMEGMSAHSPPSFIRSILQKKLLKSPHIKNKYNQLIIQLSYPIQKFNDKYILAIK